MVRQPSPLRESSYGESQGATSSSPRSVQETGRDNRPSSRSLRAHAIFNSGPSREDIEYMIAEARKKAHRDYWNSQRNRGQLDLPPLDNPDGSFHNPLLVADEFDDMPEIDWSLYENTDHSAGTFENTSSEHVEFSEPAGGGNDTLSFLPEENYDENTSQHFEDAIELRNDIYDEQVVDSEYTTTPPAQDVGCEQASSHPLPTTLRPGENVYAAVAASHNARWSRYFKMMAEQKKSIRPVLLERESDEQFEDEETVYHGHPMRLQAAAPMVVSGSINPGSSQLPHAIPVHGSEETVTYHYYRNPSDSVPGSSGADASRSAEPSQAFPRTIQTSSEAGEDKTEITIPEIMIQEHDPTPHAHRFEAPSAWSEEMDLGTVSHGDLPAAPVETSSGIEATYSAGLGNEYISDEGGEDMADQMSDSELDACRDRLLALAATGSPRSSSLSSRQDSSAPPNKINPDSSIVDPMARPLSGSSTAAATPDFHLHPRNTTAERYNRALEETEGLTMDEFARLMSQIDPAADFNGDDAGSGSEDFQPTSSPPKRQIPNRSNINGDEQEHAVLCAISESRSANVMGMAVIDLTLGQANITRIVDDVGYRRLVETIWKMPHRPQIIVLLRTELSKEGKTVETRTKSTLADILRQEFPDVTLMALDRECWRESECKRLIRRYAWKTDIAPLSIDLENNFYASCAFSAAMLYAETSNCVTFKPNSIHVTYTQAADVMGLDRSTVSCLELLQNSRRVRRGPTTTTLFGILNHTLTPQGRRLLRCTLLQPSTDAKLITERWDAVQELSSSQDFFTDVRGAFQKLLRIDIEHVMASMGKQLHKPRAAIAELLEEDRRLHQILVATDGELHGAEKNLNQILMLKSWLQGVQALHNVLKAAGCTSRLCDRAMRKSSPRYTEHILEAIGQVIEQDAIYSKRPIDLRNNRLWAIKAGPDEVLASARNYYRHRVEEIVAYADELNLHFEEQIGCKATLQLGADNHYRLKFAWSDVEKEIKKHGRKTLAGIDIVNAERKKNDFFCQTMDLIARSIDAQEHADLITQRSDCRVLALALLLQNSFSALHQTSEAVAALDMLCSFAQLATTQNYVRPVFSNSLVLLGARHPVVEVRKQSYVPNDVYSGDEELRFMVITGSNMSGKSTFIKSVALIQILAQMGCFVPATQASISICDRIFTRLSTDDKPESNLGTFSVEMTDMSVILQQATEKSMVIIDELGRGTSTKEGFSIALAMCEDLIEKGPRVLFATHFTEIGRLLNSSRRTRVLNVHLEAHADVADHATAQVSLHHKIASGPVQDQDYGINLARGELPQSVIENAQRISRFLESIKGTKKPGPATRREKIRRLQGAFLPVLRQAINSPLDNRSLAERAENLQDELRYRLSMAADEAGDEGTAAGSSDSPAIAKPGLEKISEEEKRAWKDKCNVAEERIMFVNSLGTRDEGKGKASEGEEEGLRRVKRRREEDEEKDRKKRFRRAQSGVPPLGRPLKEVKDWYLGRARRVGGE